MGSEGRIQSECQGLDLEPEDRYQASFETSSQEEMAIRMLVGYLHCDRLHHDSGMSSAGMELVKVQRSTFRDTQL